MMLESSPENSTEDEVVEEYSTLVYYLANRMVESLGGYQCVEDYAQYGFIGLIKAYRRYNALEGATFNTYAHLKIKFAIMDGHRNDAWATRGDYSRAKKNGTEQLLYLISLDGRKNSLDFEDGKASILDDISDNEDRQPEAIFIQQQESDILEQFRCSLQGKEYDIWTMRHCRMMGYGEIASKVGLCMASILNTDRRLAKRLKHRIRGQLVL